MSTTTEIDSAGYETESQRNFRHSRTINRFADYGRLVSAFIAGASLAVEEPKAFFASAAVYSVATANQILKGYVDKDCDYLIMTGFRDVFASLMGLMTGGIITGEKRFMDLEPWRLLVVESVALAGGSASHIFSRKNLRSLEEKLRPKVPLL